MICVCFFPPTNISIFRQFDDHVCENLESHEGHGADGQHGKQLDGGVCVFEVDEAVKHILLLFLCQLLRRRRFFLPILAFVRRTAVSVLLGRALLPFVVQLRHVHSHARHVDAHLRYALESGYAIPVLLLLTSPVAHVDILLFVWCIHGHQLALVLFVFALSVLQRAFTVMTLLLKRSAASGAVLKVHVVFKITFHVLVGALVIPHLVAVKFAVYVFHPRHDDEGENENENRVSVFVCAITIFLLLSL